MFPLYFSIDFFMVFWKALFFHAFVRSRFLSSDSLDFLIPINQCRYRFIPLSLLSWWLCCLWCKFSFLVACAVKHFIIFWFIIITLVYWTHQQNRYSASGLWNLWTNRFQLHRMGDFLRSLQTTADGWRFIGGGPES